MGNTVHLEILSSPLMPFNTVEDIRVHSASSLSPFPTVEKQPRPPSWTSAWGARSADSTSPLVFSNTSHLKAMALFTGHGGLMMVPTNLPHLRVPHGLQTQRQRPRPQHRPQRQATPHPLPPQPHLNPPHPVHLCLALLLRPALYRRPPSITPPVRPAGSPSLLAL